MPSANAPAADGEKTINSRGASGVGLASIVAAGSSLVIMIIAGNSLSGPDFAAFSVFWGALFGTFGTLSGIQQETTRAVRTGVEHSSGVGSRRARVLPNAIVTGGLIALVGCISSPLWAPRILGTAWLPLILVMAAAAVSYSGHAALAGASAGYQRWGLYSLLMGAESFVRLLLIAGLALIGAGLFGLEAGAAAAAVVWLGFIALSGQARRAAAARADVDRARLWQTTGHAILSALSTAVLIVGFPVLLGATSSSAEIASAGGLLLAIQLTRAPIMVPLQAFQGVAVSAFVAHRSRGVAALVKPLAFCAATGAVGAVAAGLLGPWIMSVLFPGRFDVGPYLLAALTFDAALMAAVTLSGTATLALGRHRIYSTGWVTATVVAVGLLLCPLPLGVRCSLALGLGPLAGVVVHLLGITAASHEASPTTGGKA
ncbi:hypothetical protein SPF06_14915 [Sinomonas sp. JGH33]|uniref:Polysaccharide biosynthesis protein n=1 Tax=Sinomonas terricola TaxID=3110330 RepID=A0ABU5T8Q5_9MICC|nr:hypothetical protein [Sinomonas sp. JGH33]MEA5456025.1 hypothetical protein [Sinomonas sp. JGH33]